MSVAMLCDHLGLHEAAKEINSAVAADLLADGKRARGTREIGDAIIARLK
jgi:3-isopropylmalate dehydrogenase